ncbi:MAG: type VI secretion system baseplate subunit TssK [Geminicoccaceae bacterium]
MTEADALLPPLPIDWHDGMLLAPEHFQSLSERIDTLSHYHLSQVMPFHWGVLAIAFDRATLMQGQLRIDRLDAVMPDGLIIDRAGADGELAVELTSREEAFRAGPVRVHAVVTRARRFDDHDARYRSVEGRPAHDDEGDNLPLLAPRLELWLGDRPPARFVALPLLQLEQRHDGFAVMAYQPPVPRLELAKSLVAEATDLALDIRRKATGVLEEAQGSESVGAAASTDAPAMVAALTSELPTLEALLACGASTPLELYRALLRLAGRLAVLGDMVVPPSFGAYRHHDIQMSFRPLLDFIAARLGRIRLQSVEIPFTLERGAYSLSLSLDWFVDGALVVGLRRPLDRSEAEVVAWFEAAIIGPADSLENHESHRTVGAKRQRIARHPRLRISGSAELLLFAIAWDAPMPKTNVPVMIVNRLADKRQTPPRSIVLYAPPAPAAGQDQ